MNLDIRRLLRHHGVDTVTCTPKLTNAHIVHMNRKGKLVANILIKRVELDSYGKFAEDIIEVADQSNIMAQYTRPVQVDHEQLKKVMTLRV